MSEGLTQANKRPAKRMRLSPVWLIPLGAVLIGAWLFYQNLAARGPTIILELKTAEGLEKGKTSVKVLNVDVGTVKDVRLTDDYNGAVAEISMKPEMGELLVDDTEFWVVKPRVDKQGISGLGTIISGAYIQMRPGESKQPKSRYTALEQPPPTRPDVPGITVELISQGDDTLSIGDPVVFKGQTVGQIETTEFDVDSLEVRYSIFIESPYDRLIGENTLFWLRSGIDVQLTSKGVEVQVGNLQAILAGGVTFGTPDGVKPGPPMKSGAKFVLHESFSDAEEDQYDEYLEYVVLLDDSVRGLNPGAPVEFRGLRVGTVSEVPFFNEDINIEDLENFAVPVLIRFEPQRLGDAWQNRSLVEWRERLLSQFQNGLRASVKSANLLTGALLVELQFNPQAKLAGPRIIGQYPIFPSQPGGFATLEQKVTRLLDKVNNLPIESLMAQLETSLGDASQTFAGANATLAQAEQTLDSLNTILADDALQNLPAELQATMVEVRNTLNSFQNGNPAYDNLNRSLKKLNRVLEDIAPVAETLRADPNALIFGKDTPADPVPKAAPNE